MDLVYRCKRVTRSRWFHAAVTTAILLSALLIGLETYPEVMQRHGRLLHFLDKVILGVFVVELSLRIAARGRHPWLYFVKPWNIFDFAVVAICILPLHADYLIIVRLFRIFRVLRLVTVLPRLQVLVGALVSSVPSIGYIALLLSIQFYVYSAIGVSFFGHNDPEHFGTILRGMLTLFEVLTLEGWVEIYNAQAGGLLQPGSPLLASLYFFSFILVGTMIVLNLFVGVILSAIEEQQEQIDMEKLLRNKAHGHLSLADQIDLVALQAEDLKENLHILKSRIHFDTAPYRALSLRNKRSRNKKIRTALMLSESLKKAAN